MPHYFFDIKDGHRLVDPSGSNVHNDDAAIAKARVLAIGVSLDKPAVDPTRRIAVLNADRDEISRCRSIPGQPRSALAIRLGTNQRFLRISSDRPARARADKCDRKHGIRMFGYQSPTGRGRSGPALLLLGTLDMVARETYS
jgi:hypothetical protein